MRILLIGSGGREHAFAWKIAQSPLCKKLYIAPGNAGTADCGENLALNPNNFEEIKQFVLKNEVNMIVVGPEEPLVNGIYDYFLQHLPHLPVIGPSKEGAQLEGSKAYSKQLMFEYGIPTAAYQEFTQANVEEGVAYIATQKPPIVLKADGLAAGKGVLIIDNIAEAQAELREMLGGKFGQASTKVVIEQFLKGIEFSVFVATDGTNYKVLPVAKDYKRIGEGETGLNTGGMGAISPVPFATRSVMHRVAKRIIQPTIQALKDRNIVYKGFIFLGLIMVEDEPFVIEYNCRMGDPETEVVIPRIKSDLVELFQAIHDGNLDKIQLKTDPYAAATIFLVSGGYPGDYEKGKVITGFEGVKKGKTLVFHAGTKRSGENIVTNGGRVIALTSKAKTIQTAVQRSNESAQKIEFEGKYYRSDIGFEFE
jgi:phosphoribosylamine---glycine ligase